jgi:signal peptidase I
MAALVAGCGASTGVASSPSVANSEMPPQRTSPATYRVPTLSMEPTLHLGDRVVAESRPVRVGAIIVLRLPIGALMGRCGETPWVPGRGEACDVDATGHPSIIAIKRVVAGPGDELYVQAGDVYRKPAGSSVFKREADPKIAGCATGSLCELRRPIKVPANHWYVMGDNRLTALDSRTYGPISPSWILGVMTKIASEPLLYRRKGHEPASAEVG